MKFIGLLFNGISTFSGDLTPSFFFRTVVVFNHSWEYKEVHAFPKGICLKVIVIVRLEFKLVYYDSAVQPFNNYTTMTPPDEV